MMDRRFLRISLVLIRFICSADSAVLIGVLGWFRSGFAGLSSENKVMLGVLSAQAICTGPVSEPITMFT